MTKNTKRLSALLAVLMMSSSFAAVVSAADTTFIKPNKKTESVLTESSGIVDSTTENEPSNILKTSGWVKTNASVLEDAAKNIFIKPSTQKTPVKHIYKNEKPCVVSGTYYSKKDAEKELEAYFNAHTYELFMDEGDARLFCDGAYFVSTDEDVVYYDYASSRLVANEHGNASVYVYTKGGVPFFRLDVKVIHRTGSGYSIVDVIPEDWRLDGTGDTTTFTIKSDKYTADEFKFSVVHGSSIASITKDGKLEATGNGPIVVRAYLKKNPNVYGEALLYAGEYVSSFYDGYYTYSAGKPHKHFNKYDCDCYDKYTTYYWGYDYDIGDIRDCYIGGWIKSYDGILIPVLKKSQATVVEPNGSLRDTTVVSYDNVTVADLLRDAYGDKEELYKIITKYNLFKGKDWSKPYVTYDDFDYITYILSQAWN